MPNISRLVFSGGGAKGIVYPGAYAALKETGVFDGVEDIAGSSAGAFTAALLAVGISPHEFHHTLMHINFAEYMGARLSNAWMTKDGKPMYDFLHDTIKNLILRFLKGQNLTDSHDCWTIFQTLDQTNDSPTFSDLEKLVKSWPKNFKYLTVTAVKEDGGDLKIFNHHDTPHVEIALACRASGALPIFLTPVEIDGVSYIDGGVHDNIPTESFDKNHTTDAYEKNKMPDQTLVFAFLDGDQNKKQTTLQQILDYLFGGNSVFNALYGSRKDEYENIQQFETLLELVRAELDKKIKADTNNTPIESLIDAAVDTVSVNYKTYNWSWVMHTFAVIISVIVTIWTYICSFFTTPTVDNATTQQTHATTYLNIIRNKVKEAASEVNADQAEMTEHAETICNHAKNAVDNKIHTLGPVKPPIMFDRNPIEYHAYNYIPKLLSAFKSSYHPADKIEEGYQRLRNDYPLRTVGLSVGDLSAIDFDKARKHARFMSARGYLDTINTISNLYLYSQHCFEPCQLYEEIHNDFMEIYQEILITSKQDPEQDSLLIKLRQNLSIRTAYYLIKEEAEADLSSVKAFALTRAVEFRQGELSREELFKEIDKQYLVEENESVVSTATTPTHSGNSNLFFQASMGKDSQELSDLTLMALR